MSILERWENALLDKYLDSQECCGAGDCEVSCHCDEHHDEELGYEDSDEARWADQERGDA